MIDFKLHKGQKEIALDPTRFKVLAAGRRFGKSTLSLALAFQHCLANAQSKAWIVGPTYQQTKDIFWRSVEKVPYWLDLLRGEGMTVKKNDSELLLEFPNKSILQLKGSDNEDSLRGSGLTFVVLDECSSMRPNVWQEIIQPSLIDSGGKAIFLSTPRGFNWFYDLWLKGQQRQAEWKSWRFTSYDNPTLDKNFIDQAKADSDPETFAAEFLAEFKKFVGLVYPEFDKKIHVIAPIDLDPSWTYGVGIDRGLTNPSAASLCAIDNEDNFYIYNEVYGRNLTSEQFVDLITTKAGHSLTYKFCDPSAADFMATANAKGLSILPAVKEGDMSQWVLNGIAKVKSKLKVQEGTGKPKLFIFNHCESIISEFEQYRWLEKQNKDYQSEPDRPDKVYGFDHELDALRYLIGSYKSAGDGYDTENRNLYGDNYEHLNDHLKAKWTIH